MDGETEMEPPDELSFGHQHSVSRFARGHRHLGSCAERAQPAVVTIGP